MSPHFLVLNLLCLRVVYLYICFHIIYMEANIIIICTTYNPSLILHHTETTLRAFLLLEAFLFVHIKNLQISK